MGMWARTSKGDPIHLTPHPQGNVLVQDGWAHIYDSHAALRADLERQAATHPSGPGVVWTDFGDLCVVGRQGRRRRMSGMHYELQTSNQRTERVVRFGWDPYRLQMVPVEVDAVVADVDCPPLRKGDTFRITQTVTQP